jgi:toxic protein SymE
MKAVKATRVVKLQSKYRANASAWQEAKEVPWLTISGVWLEQAGFKAGQQVEIKIERNQLIITSSIPHGNH